MIVAGGIYSAAPPSPHDVMTTSASRRPA